MSRTNRMYMRWGLFNHIVRSFLRLLLKSQKESNLPPENGRYVYSHSDEEIVYTSVSFRYANERLEAFASKTEDY